MLELFKTFWHARETRLRAKKLVDYLDIVFDLDWDYTQQQLKNPEDWEGLLLDPDLPVRWCNRDGLAAAHRKLKRIL
jgi:hypothetical protein